jgi:16S rRNA (cytidine1402-2'-O)-methyltransferase
LKGALYVVATPLGNLEDLSPRGARVLAQVKLVVAEDTRVTAKLLAHLGLRKRLLSCYRENERARIPEVLAALGSGDDVALCSDAGTPGLSDPGLELVAAAHAAGVRVVPIPGPSSIAAALSASGFPGRGFRFAGFLPRKGPDRARALAEIAAEEEPVVLFEAPGRLAGTLADLASACGGSREALLARELTKLHEELTRAPLSALVQRFSGPVRGEVTLVLGPAPPAPAAAATDEEILAALRARPASESTRERAQAVAEALGISRRRAYALALRALR